jgi:hypothetical protein
MALDLIELWRLHLLSMENSAMRAPRMTTRRLMLTVALVAASLGGLGWVEKMIQRRAHWLQRATDYAVKKQTLCCRLSDHPTAEELGEQRVMAAYYEQLVQKYECAAARPWLPVEPDPPKP